MAESGSSSQSSGRTVFIVTTTTFALASVFVFARLVSRFAIVRSRTWDDWFIILAWAIALGLSVTIDFGATRGLGSRDEDIKPEWLPALRGSEYAFTILYNPALMATKTSILIFYLRMSKNTQKVLRVASYATLALVNVAGVVLTFLNAFQCSPPDAAYDIHKTAKKCISIVTLYLCSAPVNIFANLAILILPIPVLTGMRLPQRQKTILVLTFALGIFVTVVDVVRIYYLQMAVDTQMAMIGGSGAQADFAWNASTALMWSAVEVNIGIICACIPTLKPLIKRILPTILRDNSRTSNSSAEKRSNNSSQIPPKFNSQTPQVDHVGDTVQPLPLAHTQGDESGQMGMMDFLTTPERGVNKSITSRTAATDNTVYFGFVNMKRPKSMLKVRGMESFKYCAMVTILFFLWGFSYGLLNTLNSAIARVAKHSKAKNLSLTSAYFGAYFCGSLTVGQFVLRRVGFKATFITGLCIYGTGTLMFWPCAVLASYPGFLISTFVVGFGLSVLETAANPFLALCGPSQHSEYRLLLAQGVQGVSSVFSQLLAQRVLFRRVINTPNLIDIQWTYLAVALFDVMLALFFYYMPLPEASDAELQQLSEDQGVYRWQTVLSPKFPLIYVTLALAVFTQFCYVGAQESTSVWVSTLLSSIAAQGGPPLTIKAYQYILVGHATFAVGRFLFAALTLFIAPRILLLISLIGCLLFATFITAVHSTDANGTSAFVLMFYFFEGPVFPLVFAIALRGLGARTKTGAALLTAGASGGGVFPFVMWAIQKVNGKSVQYSYCINIALFAFTLIFAFYLNVVPKARQQVNPRGNALGLPREEMEDSDRPPTPIQRFGRKLSIMISKIGGKSSFDDPVAEHRENKTANGSPDLARDDGTWGTNPPSEGILKS